MAEYYLISQLPSLDGLSDDAPTPITEERFSELCSRYLSKKALFKIESLTLIPPVDFEKSGSPFIEKWNSGERELRLALAKVRAEKMKKAFDSQGITLSSELIKTAEHAAEIENPLESEEFLTNYRLRFLESLRPTDSFSDDYLFYYGLKLKLISRMREFNGNIGEESYKNISNSILKGDKLDAI